MSLKSWSPHFALRKKKEIKWKYNCLNRTVTSLLSQFIHWRISALSTYYYWLSDGITMVTGLRKPSAEWIYPASKAVSSQHIDPNVYMQTYVHTLTLKYTQPPRQKKKLNHFSETGTNWMTFKWMEALVEQMSSFLPFLSQFRPPSGYQTEITLKWQSDACCESHFSQQNPTFQSSQR